MTQRTRRALFVTLVAAALLMAAPGPSSARQLGGWRAPALERAWTWLARLWPAEGKEGSGINPDGRPTGNKEGSVIDPDGRPLPPPAPTSIGAGGGEGTVGNP